MKFHKYLYIIIAFLLLLFTFLLKRIDGFSDKNEEFNHFISQHQFLDEKNNIIDHLKEENTEQYQAFKYISKDDIVLELGGRYGSVSVVINKLVDNKEMHVVVEPDENVIDALNSNLKRHNCTCSVLPKFVSNSNKKLVYAGYGTLVESSDTKNPNQISYDEFKSLYPQKFNVLVADCEGCLYDFLEMMGNDFNHLNKVIFEADQPKNCDYNKVKEKLKNAGFKEIDNHENFRFVYIK